MVEFDKALVQFKKMINYDNPKKKIIEMDYLVDAIADFMVDMIQEYKSLKYVGRKILENPTYGVIEFNVYSVPSVAKRFRDFIGMVDSLNPLDLKNREEWSSKKLGIYMFRGICRSNDYLGNYLYGIVGKEMFTIHDGLNVASDLLLIYGAGYAQQLSNWKQMMDKDELNVADYVIAGQIWTIIVVSSGFKKTGDNEEDVEMIEDGMEVWKEKYGR